MTFIVPNSVTPATPAAGNTDIFVGTDKRLSTVDDAGLVRKMLEEAAALYRLILVTEVFQGTTGYTPTSGADALFVECVGAGGQGGGVATAATNSGAGGGGGAGAYSALFTTSIKTFSVVVGLGGSTTVAGSGTGQSGTDTTFDSPSICTAKGGSGGLGDTIATIHVGGLGGAGGASASGVGDIKAAGSAGQAGLALAAAQAVGGIGGAGFFGGAAPSVKTQSAGGTGGNYGGGGGGGVGLSGGASVAGGAGGNGIIRVWEFQAIT